MAVKYAKAMYRPLGEQTQPKMKAHNIICLHTMVGPLTSSDRMFHDNGFTGTESHFGVGGKWGDGRDGEVLQWQDLDHTADANLEGAPEVISIETGDNFPKLARDIEPWTEKQMTALAELVAWLCRKYDIPCKLIPDTKPGRRGIGYHRLGVQHSGGTHPAGFLQPGGRKWSTSVGKECPGQARIDQMPELIRRAAALLQPKEEDPMAGITLDQIKAVVRDAVPTVEEIAAQVIVQLATTPIAVNKPSQSEIDAAKLAGKPVPTGSAAPAAWFLQNIEADGDNATAEILAKLDEVLDAVKGLSAALVGPPK